MVQKRDTEVQHMINLFTDAWNNQRKIGVEITEYDMGKKEGSDGKSYKRNGNHR